MLSNIVSIKMSRYFLNVLKFYLKRFHKNYFMSKEICHKVEVIPCFKISLFQNSRCLCHLSCNIQWFEAALDVKQEFVVQCSKFFPVEGLFFTDLY